MAAMNLSQCRSQLNRSLAEYAHAQRSCTEEAGTLERAKGKVAHLEEAQRLVQGVATAVQEESHKRIASVVSRCLESVFGESAYQFRINFRKLRGKTEAELVFVRGGKEIDPTGAAGGGVIDVAGTGLRIACLLLSMPRKRRLLVLDEPWRFLSKVYRPAMRDLVLTLSREMNLQFVVVTHSEEFKIGKVIELE